MFKNQFESCRLNDLTYKTTRLNDVSTDCMLKMVENYKQFDLNAIGTQNIYLLKVAIRELERRFATKQVYFDGLHQVDDNIEENETEICVVGDTIFVQIFEEFGDSLRNLKIHADTLAKPAEAQEMFSLIKEH